MSATRYKQDRGRAVAAILASLRKEASTIGEVSEEMLTWALHKGFNSGAAWAIVEAGLSAYEKKTLDEYAENHPIPTTQQGGQQ